MVAHTQTNNEQIKGTIKSYNAMESVLAGLLLDSNKCVIYYYYRLFRAPTIPIHIQCSHSFLNVNNFITVIVS